MKNKHIKLIKVALNIFKKTLRPLRLCEKTFCEKTIYEKKHNNL